MLKLMEVVLDPQGERNNQEAISRDDIIVVLGLFPEQNVSYTCLVSVVDNARCLQIVWVVLAVEAKKTS
ncbi:unnamed protein product [Eruca vesicaria subsp. sativa]|uniref:Uncharacterized protein n=1 Tax=Eruca vesicaria subsp. sativa TaxID=29727 RepID=A0ABC8KF05_ERUVS|nr:unnamed protein product [Eruca vesicaria subsp. sativa]